MTTRATNKKKAHAKQRVSLFQKLYPEALFTFVVQEGPRIARDLQHRAEVLVDKTPLKGHIPFLSQHNTTGGKRKKAADVLASIHKSKPWQQLKILSRRDIQIAFEKVSEKIEEVLHIPTRSELNRLHEQVQEIESKLAELRGNNPIQTPAAKKSSEKHVSSHPTRNFSA